MTDRGYRITISGLEGYISKFDPETKELWGNNKLYIDKLSEGILRLLEYMVEESDQFLSKRRISNLVAKEIGIKENILRSRFIPNTDYYKALDSTELSKALRDWIDWINYNWGRIEKTRHRQIFLIRNSIECIYIRGN